MELTVVLVAAVVVFLLTLIFGEEVGALMKMIGLVLLMMPILFYFIDGTAGMLSSNVTNAQIVAESTATKILEYVVVRLPGIIISDIAGALLGVLLGLLARFAEAFQ